MNTSESSTLLITYGWNDHFSGEFLPFESAGCVPARIIRSGPGIFRAVGEDGELTLRLSGSFQYRIDLGLQQMPVVGDWCAIGAGTAGSGLIEGVLPRKTFLNRLVTDASRHAPGQDQTAVTNIDTVAVVMDISAGFSIRRMERFIANIEAGGAASALILSKIDLIDNPEAYRRRVTARFGNLPVYLVDSISGHGREELDELFLPGRCVALQGLSGAGKSTLLNMLLGQPAARTSSVREKDGRGRHTTTARQMYLLPGNALVIDTPGIRSVGMAAGRDAVTEAFEDIAELSRHCRFSDCTHRNEPGCAVRDALNRGEIEPDRYLHFLTLLKEAGDREEELRMRREKDRHFGQIRYRWRRDHKDD